MVFPHALYSVRPIIGAIDILPAGPPRFGPCIVPGHLPLNPKTCIMVARSVEALLDNQHRAE